MSYSYWHSSNPEHPIQHKKGKLKHIIFFHVNNKVGSELLACLNRFDMPNFEKNKKGPQPEDLNLNDSNSKIS